MMETLASSSPSPLESETELPLVQKIASGGGRDTRRDIWRWQVISGLVGSLLALGYQWRVTGGLFNFTATHLNEFSLAQFTSISQIWQIATLMLPLSLFLGGWLLGGLVLWCDERWSQRLYESGPLTRSIGFLAVLLVVGGFVVTTSGSGLGIGLVLGLLTGIWGEVLLWQSDPMAFRQRFLHDIRPQAVVSLERQWQGRWGVLVSGIWLVMILLALI